jgi:hypothetical protein
MGMLTLGDSIPGFRNMRQMPTLMDAQRLGPLPEDIFQTISEQDKSASFEDRS